jgi:SAM-dependent methyltransferase
MARRGKSATALDCSEAMVRYGLAKAREEGLAISYIHSDMIEFDLGCSFDITALLMDSASYLLTNDDVYRNFRAVARHLVPGGLYILEIPHPQHTFGVRHVTDTDWEATRGDTNIRMQWGLADDPFDPITQVRDVTVVVTITRGDDVQTIREQARQRSFTTNELRALVDASGCFQMVDIFGAMDASVPFSNTKESWRMVSVLQRI